MKKTITSLAILMAVISSRSLAQDAVTGVISRIAAPVFEQNVSDSWFAIVTEGETYYVMVDGYWPNPDLLAINTQENETYYLKPYIYTFTAPDYIAVGDNTAYVGDSFIATGMVSNWYHNGEILEKTIDITEISNNILLDPRLKDISWKMLKVQFESSGCEIQKWMEKGFVGFACFGYKQFKLYIIALK